MSASALRYSAMLRLATILLTSLICANAWLAAEGQESVLVVGFGDSVYDLTLQRLAVSAPPLFGEYMIAVAPNNPRLAYVLGNGGYIKVVDLTLEREVNRIYGACPNGYSAFTPDGKYLLVADCNSPTLDIIDLARQALVRKVNLSRALGSGARYTGSIVAVGNKSYVTNAYGSSSHSAVALVDLKTFQVRPIWLPATTGSFNGFAAPNAAVTPDQKYVIVAQDSYNGNNYLGSFLYFISTATNTVVKSVQQSIDPEGILVTPANNTGSVYGYLLGISTNTGNPAAIILDLNPGSQTFGQQLPGTTEVDLQFPNADVECAALSADGTRLVVGGYLYSPTSQSPNLDVLDTGLMISNPGNAVIAQTVSGQFVGDFPQSVAVANVMLTPPSTAPTVSSVTSPITNDVANTITVSGSNFQPGARVRVGTMSPVAANVVSPSTLTAIVPQNAPGIASQDVVVMNPGLSGPANQQYQSGVLPASLSVMLNPAYQPQNRFAAFSIGGLPPEVYDPTSGSMITNLGTWIARGISFNADGNTIYGLTMIGGLQAVAWDSSTLSVVAQIPLHTNLFTRATGASALAASVNPQTGRPRIVVPVETSPQLRTYDVALAVIDSDSSSNTYNTVLFTTPTGQSFSSNVFPYGCAVTPDGHYAYLSYGYHDPITLVFIYAIAIFDLSTPSGTFLATFNASTLGISPNYQTDLQVTSDGRSLILSGANANRYAGPIAVLDITHPTNPTLVTTITGTPPAPVGVSGAFNFSSYQVVGNRLFAFDYITRTVVIFNFDRTTPDFSQLATYRMGGNTSGVYGVQESGSLTVSPDGALVYVTNPNTDAIT
ncbi:MAG: hypothetical protein WBS19_14055, partial [Candidatus Korobacteraceae bacterium]